jgi:hypothetical protein
MQSTPKQKCTAFAGACTTMKNDSEGLGESNLALTRGEKFQI